MKQTRLMSLVESITNVIVGYVLAVPTQVVVFSWLGIEISLAENLGLGMAFVGVSVARGYLLRRFFEVHSLQDQEVAITGAIELYQANRRSSSTRPTRCERRYAGAMHPGNTAPTRRSTIAGSDGATRGSLHGPCWFLLPSMTDSSGLLMCNLYSQTKS